MDPRRAWRAREVISMHIPMFGFVLLAFLLLGVVLAVAVFFAFKSGNAGQTRLSGPAGCLIALALLVIAGIGAIGLAIVALVTLPAEAMKHGPVKSFELQFPDEETVPDVWRDNIVIAQRHQCCSGVGLGVAARRHAQRAERAIPDCAGHRHSRIVFHGTDVHARSPPAAVI